MSIQINGTGTITGVSGIESVLATDVDFTPAGTGAVATTVQAKLRETVSVKDFGADPAASAAVAVPLRVLDESIRGRGDGRRKSSSRLVKMRQ